MRLPNQLKQRVAATLLEVLFATVVLVVGLLGIATLIPFAARDAQEANNNNQALSLGLGWADSFFARGFHHLLPDATEESYRWYWRNDPVPGPQTWQNFDTSPGGSYSKFSTTKISRPWGSQPVCLDPYLMTSQSPVSLFDRSSAAGAYRASVFPYFDDGYDPTSNPLSPVGTAFDQPRMLRATLGYTSSVAPRKLIETIFGSVDDLVSDTYIDPAAANEVSDTLPEKRLFNLAVGSNSIDVPLNSKLEGRYTWMATICPSEPLATFATSDALISFVILHRHNHQIDFTSLPNPNGERTARVQALSGNFVGGSGGRVRLICNSDIDDKLEIGNWITLSRFYKTGVNGPYFPHFRWYRIIGLDANATYNGSTWSRDVVLDGPDFNFDFSGSADLQTYGTIVGGVITVVERMARIGQ